MVDDPKTIMEALSKVVGILKINVRQYVLIVQDCRVLILGEVVVLACSTLFKSCRCRLQKSDNS